MLLEQEIARLRKLQEELQQSQKNLDLDVGLPAGFDGLRQRHPAKNGLGSGGLLEFSLAQ